MGPDGNLWFTEFDANKIGQVVLSAAAPAPDLKLAGTAPSSVTLGQQRDLQPDRDQPRHGRGPPACP